MEEKSLTDFVSSVCNESHLRVETDLGDGFVRLKGEEAERRQAAHDIRSTEDALIELLRNSRDAHARMVFVSSMKLDGERSLVVIDDGDGVPEGMWELVFEPRVTSKLDSMHFDKWGVHGRGMALYSIKVNAKEAYISSSARMKGSSFSTLFDLSRIAEKADQSSFPRFVLGEQSSVTVRGPKNLLRTTAEFAFEHRESLSVYIGSASEIAATLYAYGNATLSLVDRTFASGTEDIPLIKRLSLAADEETFCEVAQSLGLQLSERTARRILDGQIKPVASVMDVVQDQLLAQLASQQSDTDAHKEKTRAKRAVSRVVARVAREDLDAFKRAVKADYAALADAYYLSSDVEPSVTVKGDSLVVRIPLAQLD